MRILNRPLIAIWLTIVVCSGIALTVFEDGPFIVSAISLIIGLQALVSELLGVVVNSEGIWFPIRLSLGLPLMTLWRGRILENRFDRIDRAGPKSIVISGSGEEVIVDLSTHEHQKSFLRYASHVFPRKNVS